MIVPRATARFRARMQVKMPGSMAGDGDFRRLGPDVLLRTSGAGGMGPIDLALRRQAEEIAASAPAGRLAPPDATAARMLALVREARGGGP